LLPPLFAPLPPPPVLLPLPPAMAPGQPLLLLPPPPQQLQPPSRAPAPLPPQLQLGMWPEWQQQPLMGLYAAPKAPAPALAALSAAGGGSVQQRTLLPEQSYPPLPKDGAVGMSMDGVQDWPPPVISQASGAALAAPHAQQWPAAAPLRAAAAPQLPQDQGRAPPPARPSMPATSALDALFGDYVPSTFTVLDNNQQPIDALWCASPGPVHGRP
jgi:type VI secretion system secreted protein VgrG